MLRARQTAYRMIALPAPAQVAISIGGQPAAARCFTKAGVAPQIVPSSSNGGSGRSAGCMTPHVIARAMLSSG